MRFASCRYRSVWPIVLLWLGLLSARGAEEVPAKVEDHPPSSRLYLSAQKILADLPPEARPVGEAGWSASAREQAEAWLAEHAVGAGVRLDAQLARVEVVEGEGGALWQVYFAFRAPPFAFGQVRVRPLVGAVGSSWPPGRGTGEGTEPIPDPLRVVVKEDFGRRARDMKPGQSMRVLGVIQAIKLRPVDDTGRVVFLLVRLVRYQVASGKSAARAPKG